MNKFIFILSENHRMKTFILTIVLIMFMNLAMSQSNSNSNNDYQTARVENISDHFNSLQIKKGEHCILNFQNNFSAGKETYQVNVRRNTTDWRLVRRTGGYVMLAGVGLTVLGGVIMKISPSDNNIGVSVGDVVGVVSVGGGVLGIFSGAIVTIVGSIGSATHNHRYGFQFQSRKDGVSLVYHF